MTKAPSIRPHGPTTRILRRPVSAAFFALAGAAAISLVSSSAAAQNFSGAGCDFSGDTCFAMWSPTNALTTVFMDGYSTTGNYRNIRWTVNGNYQGQFQNSNANYTWANSPAGKYGVAPVLDNAVFDVSMQSCWTGTFGSTCTDWAEAAIVTPSDATTLFTVAPLHPDGGSNLCLDLPASDTTNGNQLQIWTCNGTQAQQWTYQADGTIHSAINYNKCVDLSGSNTANGTPVQIWDCNGSFAQKWTYQGATRNIRGYYGHCVDVPGSNFSSGQKLQYYSCNGSAAQVWNR
jgi:hypothetical protein